MAALLKTLRFFNSAMKFDIMNGYEQLYRNLAKGVSLNQIKQNKNSRDRKIPQILLCPGDFAFYLNQKLGLLNVSVFFSYL